MLFLLVLFQLLRYRKLYLYYLSLPFPAHNNLEVVMTIKPLAVYRLLIGKLCLALIFCVAMTLPQSSLAEQTQHKSSVNSWQLMSLKERKQHRVNMRRLKTEKAREAYRKQHRVKMKARADARGLTLHEEPKDVTGWPWDKDVDL